MSLRVVGIVAAVVCVCLGTRADSFRPPECRPISLQTVSEGPAPAEVPPPVGLSWYWFANHTHTEYSDGPGEPTNGVTVELRIRLAAQEGADAVAITDHGRTVACSDPMFQTLDGCVPMCGEEWGSDVDGDVGLLNFSGPPVGGTLEELIVNATARGATIVANHPFAFSDPWTRQDLEFGIHGIEVMTTSLYVLFLYDYAIDWWNGFLAKGRQVSAIAGSDHHTLTLNTMKPCNYVLAASAQPDDLQDALEAGRLILCSDIGVEQAFLWCDANGDGAFESATGDNVIAGSARTLTFRVEAHNAEGRVLRVFTKQGQVQTFTVGAGEPWAVDFAASVGADTKDFVRAELVRENQQDPMASLTNPIYVNYTPGDADSDGLPDTREAQAGADHYDSDTDKDGVRDGFEIGYDGDLNTYDPYNPDTNPTGADLDVLSEDTDGDGFKDSDELTYETDPLDASSVPELPSTTPRATLLLMGAVVLTGTTRRFRQRRHAVQ